MRKMLVMMAVLTLLAVSAPLKAHADGCYTCKSDSTCGSYCKYTGEDTFENRKICEKKGCKIAGTSSCPQAANYKVCSVEVTKSNLLSYVMAADVQENSKVDTKWEERADKNDDGRVDKKESAAFKKHHKKHDNDNNPPGAKGGPGTNWENPPGPKGGPGASPNKK